MSKQKSLSDFFAKDERKKRQRVCQDESDTTAPKHHGHGAGGDIGAAAVTTNAGTSTQEEPQQAPTSAVTMPDIADFVQLSRKASGEEKFRLIENRSPHPLFKFPSRDFRDKRKESGVAKRYCQYDWFKTFPFLCYSAKEDGLYCLPCVLFPAKPMKGARSKLLISQPYRNWKDARSDINVHSTLEYHKAAVFIMSNFSKTMVAPEQRIDHSLSEKGRERIQKNRKFLKSILKTVEICGRQGWALRGHRDAETSSALNKGNFKALLDFRIDAGDGDLEEHINSAARNALYTSPACQNDLLHCIKEYIQEVIISEVKAQPLGPLYTVEADEVTDVANWEQLAIVIRYLKDNQPVERLVGYVACDSITGEEIRQNILGTLTALGLDPQDCRGQTYDGAGNMAGKERGSAARFQAVSPRAHYHHCSSHSLNLALSKACSVAEINCMLATIKSTGLFFQGSPKRSRQLEKAINEVNTRRREDQAGGKPQIPLQKLKLLCETRWVERHTTLDDFVVLYEPVLDCLDMIRAQRDQTWSSKAITEANGLIASLTTSSFIVACVCASYVFGFSKSLSVMLQGTSMDVIRAYEQITMVTDEIKAVRENDDAEFDRLFTSMSTMAEAAGIEITIPRTGRRQTNRTNVPADGSIKVYWKRAVFIPYLDGLISELSNRFTNLSHQAVRALCLLPANLDLCSDDKIDAIMKYYGPDLPSPTSAFQEIRLWKRFWKDNAERPQSVSDTLKQMNCKQFPNVCAVLQVLLLLPVTSAEVERVHSAFKIIKTDLRSTMLEERLNALILLYYHKDIALDYDAIINIYSRKHPRRMMFLNPMEEK